MSETCVRITLRIPPELHALAVELAKKTDRSLNGQMVHMMRIGAEHLKQREEPAMK